MSNSYENDERYTYDSFVERQNRKLVKEIRILNFINTSLCVVLFITALFSIGKSLALKALKNEAVEKGYATIDNGFKWTNKTESFDKFKGNNKKSEWN